MSATHVFANGHEIASKAVGKSGRSSSAMPDPCWSPPAPGAGPVVIPYPNTCFADSITKGTTTVMIAGKTVAIADQSRFDTSIGNEGATQAFNKGVATGVIKGKAYFTKWSSDVVFEGYGVPRDMDLVTHNHGSQPSNTPTFPFISTRDLAGDCKQDVERVNAACGPVNEHSYASRDGNKLRAALRKTHKANGTGEWNWTHDHCDGLDLALGSNSSAKKYLSGMAENFKAAADDLQALIGIESTLIEAATTSFPVDPKAAAASLQKRAVLQERLEKTERLRRLFENGNTDDSTDGSGKTDQGLGADAQDNISELNDCTRARKCTLTPFSTSDEYAGREHSQKFGKGCCNGQTGHHLIYGAMMKGACADYDNAGGNRKHKDAPTVCVEGASQHVGSHGRVHDAMDRVTKSFLKAQKRKPDAFGKVTLSLDEAISLAVKSHQSAFPMSGCSSECTRKQLESYYFNACKDARPVAKDKMGRKLDENSADKSVEDSDRKAIKKPVRKAQTARPFKGRK